MTITTGNPINMLKKPARLPANTDTFWGMRRAKLSQTPAVDSLRDSTFITRAPYAFGGTRTFSVKAEDLTDLPRDLVNLFGLVLFHVDHLFALNKLVGVRSRNVCGRVAGMLLPNLLHFG
jgi:hypothetical protein